MIATLLSTGLRATLLALALCGPAMATPTSDADGSDGACLPLWPGGLAPGDERLPEPLRIVERSHDPRLPDRYAERISEPCMTVHRPARPSGVALLVMPGGGYQRVVLDKEGSALLPAFVDQGGTTLFVLRYRLPGEGHRDRDAALADAQRALRLIRAGAGRWGIDPRRVGTMGFSAGGHLAARLGTGFARQLHPPLDAADRLDARPDFQLLVYPVIDLEGPDAHPGSRRQLLGDDPAIDDVRRYSMHNNVDPSTPPTFLLHAQDDEAVPVGNSLLFYQALQRAGVPAQMHLFPRGGHGFGVRGTAGLTVAAWPRLALDWIHALPME